MSCGDVIVREGVHGYKLLEAELAIQVTEMFQDGTYTHPIYKYEIEAGGYCQWDASQLRKKKLLSTV